MWTLHACRPAHHTSSVSDAFDVVTSQEEISRLKEELAQRQSGPAARVVERVVEVEADGQLLEQLRDKMRSEIEAKIRSDMSAEAVAKARAEAEAHARAQLEAAMAGSSHSEEQRRALREALEHMDGEMETIAAAADADRRAQEELMAKIAAMESKVCADVSVQSCACICGGLHLVAIGSWLQQGC